MKAGKLSEAALKRSVLGQLRAARPEVRTGPGVGLDGAVIRAKDSDVVCAVSAGNPALIMQGRLVVYTACNNIVCRGAEPVGILVNLMLPTDADEQILRDMTGEIEKVCEAERLQVLGGHTQVLRAVDKPLVSVTAVGCVRAGTAVIGKAEPGMDIVMAGWAGQAGAAILAREREDALKGHYAGAFIEQAKVHEIRLSVRDEAEAAAGAGASCLHDGSEGGIFGALWEMGEGSGVGLEIKLKDIPIRQETVEISEFFHVNPYKLLSTGCLLIAAADGGAAAAAIWRARGAAAVIGKVTDGNDRVLLCGEERRFLETPQTDELYKIIRS